MFKKTMLGAVLALILAIVAPPAFAQDVSGVYVGTYTATQVPGEIQIVLVFRQSGTTLDGQYHTASGVDGVGHGILSNGTANMDWTNTTQSCPGTSPGTTQGPYTFANQAVTWTYSGKDCVGDESGAGKATLQSKF